MSVCIQHTRLGEGGGQSLILVFRKVLCGSEETVLAGFTLFG